jgi:hypothetical protein
MFFTPLVYSFFHRYKNKMYSREFGFGIARGERNYLANKM